MLLNFFGTGSGFTNNHTNAYFFHENDLILIDLSMLNLPKVLDLIQSKYIINIYAVITHMHDDHVSGIPLLIQHLYHNMNAQRLKIVIPYELLDDITTELRIKGILPGSYEILLASQDTNKDIADTYYANKWLKWFKKCIPTSHAPELKGKCFGYEFRINSHNVLYTGDTNCLKDFLPYIEDIDEFYIDCSFSYSDVHLSWFNEFELKYKLEDIATQTDIYLMHIDDLDAAKREDLRSVKLATYCGKE